MCIWCPVDHVCRYHYTCTADIGVGGDSTQTGIVVIGTENYTANISVDAKADQIGQEGVETIEIPLSVTSEELAVPVFVEGPALVTVNDRSGEKVSEILHNYAFLHIVHFVLGKSKAPGVLWIVYLDHTQFMAV